MIRALKRLRMEKHLLQKELADLSGVSQSTICMMEQYGRNVSGKTLVKLADALGCDVRDLIETEDDKTA